MLNYLEQGIILYVMGAICFAGVVSKFLANHFYKSLIRQSDNLTAAKDKQLQQMKMKYESIYRMNCGMKNIGAYVEKMLQQYRVAKVRLLAWESAGAYSGIIAFLIGAVSALVLYMNGGKAQTCIMYLAAGSLMAAAMLAFSGIMDSSSYRQALEAGLNHYFENVLVVRSARNMEDAMVEEELARESLRTAAASDKSSKARSTSRARGSMRDDLFIRKQENEYSDQDRMQETQSHYAGGQSKQENRFESTQPRQESIQGGIQQRQLDELKESLAQIAAAKGDSSEKNTGKQNARKLTAKEEQLINEIINQYLS